MLNPGGPGEVPPSGVLDLVGVVLFDRVEHRIPFVEWLRLEGV